MATKIEDMPFLEKHFDLTVEGTDYDIRKYLAAGWYIHYQGITLVIMRKDVEGGNHNDCDAGDM